MKVCYFCIFTIKTVCDSNGSQQISLKRRGCFEDGGMRRLLGFPAYTVSIWLALVYVLGFFLSVVQSF